MLLLPGLFLLLLTGCGGQDGLQYKAMKKLKKNGVVFSAKISADRKTGVLTLSGEIENGSGETVSVSAFRAGLRSGKGYLNIPVNTDSGSFAVSASESRSFTFEYKPVNDPQLYQRIRFRGDLSRMYTLDMSFITTIDGKVIFNSRLPLKAEKQNYVSYLKKYSRNPALCVLQIDKEAFQEEASGIL